MLSLEARTARAVAAALRGTDLRLRTVTNQHVDMVLRLVDGNVSIAARLLGVNRRSLQRRAARQGTRRRGRRGR